MTPDPPVRTDGKCACGCGRTVRVTLHRLAGPLEQFGPEPFARTECCKAWHGVDFGLGPKGKRRMKEAA